MVNSNTTIMVLAMLVGSNLTKPDKACCPEFAGLLESNPICLCSLIGQSDQYGVDLSRALMLPDACKVEIPSLDSCPAAPVSAPSISSPSEAPGSTAAGPMPDGGAALSPAASGNGGSNGASSNAVHDLSTIICLGVAIFIAYYF
nr:non-specific lipid transfer protein GPI-anchored 2-like [Tanacetum cinerariifolium]